MNYKRPAGMPLKVSLVLAAIVSVLSPHVCSQDATRANKGATDAAARKSDAVAGAAANAKQRSREQGKAIFQTTCQVCHSDGEHGGCLAPILAGESARRTRAFILDRITDSQAARTRFAREYHNFELMPHMRVNSDEAGKLATYILSLPATGEITTRGHSSEADKQENGSTTNHQIAANQTVQTARGRGSVQSGKKLLWEKGCLACHSVSGAGGTYAPAFDAIGARRSEEWIGDKISKAQLFVREGDQLDEYSEKALTMPPVEISRSEIADIASYLSTLK